MFCVCLCANCLRAVLDGDSHISLLLPLLSHRRVGHTDINATVEVTVVTGNATIQCTHLGDVCAANSSLEFLAGMEEAEYRFTLYSDLLVEDAESFSLQLTDGVGMVPLSERKSVEVIILDSAAPRELHTQCVCVCVWCACGGVPVCVCVCVCVPACVQCADTI